MNLTGKAIAAYAIAVNGAAFALFASDKFMAKAGAQRVPENMLHLSALSGGWIGGIMAMETFRHKTKKTSFRVPYFMCVGANVLGCAVLCVHPGFRSQISRVAANLKSM